MGYAGGDLRAVGAGVGIRPPVGVPYTAEGFFVSKAASIIPPIGLRSNATPPPSGQSAEGLLETDGGGLWRAVNNSIEEEAPRAALPPGLLGSSTAGRRAGCSPKS